MPNHVLPIFPPINVLQNYETERNSLRKVFGVKFRIIHQFLYTSTILWVCQLACDGVVKRFHLLLTTVTATDSALCIWATPADPTAMLFLWWRSGGGAGTGALVLCNDAREGLRCIDSEKWNKITWKVIWKEQSTVKLFTILSPSQLEPAHCGGLWDSLNCITIFTQTPHSFTCVPRKQLVFS